MELLLSDLRQIAKSPIFERADGVFCASCCFPYNFLIPLSQQLNLPIKMTSRTEKTVNMVVYWGEETTRIHPLNYAIFVHPRAIGRVNGFLRTNSVPISFA